eukprot:CAMPEP_0174889456 /NCGR_PEP_ID=MMETSP0167-20121228/4712_1 /TAXON_ID=38298 /ORGANISM="Rhodella maculata, Strain CCMP736" /LENGTH=223 /DNA_ID=CAMNT_0016126867 /DNA_START=33 /DNA_END=701 /DNA_ORIENTATION=+
MDPEIHNLLKHLPLHNARDAPLPVGLLVSVALSLRGALALAMAAHKLAFLGALPVPAVLIKAPGAHHLPAHPVRDVVAAHHRPIVDVPRAHMAEPAGERLGVAPELGRRGSIHVLALRPGALRLKLHRLGKLPLGSLSTTDRQLLDNLKAVASSLGNTITSLHAAITSAGMCATGTSAYPSGMSGAKVCGSSAGRSDFLGAVGALGAGGAGQHGNGEEEDAAG